MRQWFSRLCAIALLAGGMIAATTSAQAAGVTATVDLSAQRMYVSVGRTHAYTWKISSGRKGYRTPTGTYRPTRMYRKYYSQKYDNAPMPNSVFFRGGYAIHGTGYVKNLGRPASHGCIRLHPTAARAFYDLVQQHGRGNTSIRIRY
ncbi:hypothetical protein DLJ53_26030 [Acuticoccus sediminis]|uniref:L,D-TPase catalytic domain-containing protein n=1 Tax=Acuticoccus sediminis TaxID=2184697 RepID=A0A8B2NNE6_9HYPH|nr:L,D-transpeptidase [Acuticoccus sediminis]RAH98179.1 hypothetical protein DLJ53_26030 [Acuticoccus sediminis]